ncbi:MBL fold metallo-hydrolase [Gordonia sp. TBRC 11910]|uniref:MBL fold metallo-hydrolase n=1 Tax=Gordonia asplenii TaxID=2725283 RepID=A0A848L049_9ACTN|nr:cyclic nucleotide-degrading phosphodiesterase [Gordonia asplenii]NMO04304.1 MBL fold metallo-hydrolase [Gordonia asplenii]
MRLTVLGCSGSVGGPSVACSGYLLTVPDQQPVLLDCGPGVFGELQKYVDPNDVAVALSHLHADHCMDLPAMLVWRRYAPTPAVGRAPMWGPPGAAQRIGAGSSEYAGDIDDISDTFDSQDWVEGKPVELGGMTLVPTKMDHPPETYGVRVTGPEGQTLVYSGDTGACDQLIEMASDADVFLCEASWTHAPDERPPHLHLSGIEAGEAAAKARVKHLALTHIPPWTSTDDIVAEARSVYSGPITVVAPGQIIDVTSTVVA